jgi:hypothetical protein
VLRRLRGEQAHDAPVKVRADDLLHVSFLQIEFLAQPLQHGDALRVIARRRDLRGQRRLRTVAAREEGRVGRAGRRDQWPRRGLVRGPQLVGRLDREHHTIAELLGALGRHTRAVSSTACAAAGLLVVDPAPKLPRE